MAKSLIFRYQMEARCTCGHVRTSMVRKAELTPSSGTNEIYFSGSLVSLIYHEVADPDKR